MVRMPLAFWLLLIPKWAEQEHELENIINQ
jgi:hypothetical protein